MKFKVAVFLLILLVIFGSCASEPPFRVDSVPLSSMQGKTVFLEIEMAEWIKVIFPLLDAAIYNGGLAGSAQEFKAQQDRKIIELQEKLAFHYRGIYDIEVVYDKYPFNKDVEINFFSTASEDIKSTIIEICAKHGAEYVFTLIGQPATQNVSAFGINGNNMLSFNMVLFDKAGNIVTKGSARAFVTMGSGDVSKYISLFDTISVSLQSMISSIGQR